MNDDRPVFMDLHAIHRLFKEVSEGYSGRHIAKRLGINHDPVCKALLSANSKYRNLMLNWLNLNGYQFEVSKGGQKPIEYLKLVNLSPWVPANATEPPKIKSRLDAKKYTVHLPTPGQLNNTDPDTGL